MLVLLLFFGSGATALIYEVVWSKYLALMLGSTVQAQTVVLAVFMGGLAIGNRLFGRRSARIGNPVLAYGILEFIIGVYAFFFPNLYNFGDWIFVSLGSKVADVGALLLLLKLVLSVCLLIVPTVLMGGTLPLLAGWIQQQSGIERGARVGIFYAVNSLGAVLGAGLAGFYVVQNLGLVSGLELTGAANVFIALVALVLGKRESLKELYMPSAPEPVAPAAPPPPGAPFRFGLLVGFTGAVSMGLEVLYSRALALIAGGSLQAFALVLMSFILGIGLGSVAISSAKAARKYGLNTIYFLLLGAAAIVITNVLLIEEWTVLYSQAKFGLARNPMGYAWHQIAMAATAFILLGLPAAFLGAVVPLSIRLLESSQTTLGDQVGRLLTANTIGAVTGVLLTGFFLMPVIGLRGALGILAIALIVVTALVAFQREQSRMMMTAVVLVCAAIAAIASTGDRWRTIMGAGIFRLRDTSATRGWIQQRKAEGELLYYKDSADATVSVERSHSPGDESQIILRINGKTDASSRGDLSTQYLLAHLPMMARPDAKQAFVLGFGSGITAGSLLGHPIERVTIAENCRPVLEASYLFAEWNHGVRTNSRARIINEDARAVLKLRPDKYDIIISEPSNPWVVGIGSVFSQEFYQMAADRLVGGGIMAQWFHKYEMSDNIIFLVIRTFGSVFPHLEIWDTQDGDIILLGSNQPWESNPAQYQKIFERPGPRQDLSKIGLNSAVSLWMRQIASQKTAFAITGDGPVQTDEFPILEYHAPRSFFMAQQANLLYAFDERTIQWPLADRAKLAVLRALPLPLLIDCFGYYGSSNPEVRMYLAVLQSRQQGGNPRMDPMKMFGFRPPDDYPAEPVIRTNTSPRAAECLRAELALIHNDANWKEGALRIEKVLMEVLEENKTGGLDFSPAYYAAMATRFAIGHGDFVMALRMLRLGFVFARGDAHLEYLSRVLDRVVDPEVLEEIRRITPISTGTNQPLTLDTNQSLNVLSE
jgi:spermidine synthase